MATSVSGLTLYFLQGVIAAYSNMLAPLNAFSFNVNQEGAGLNDIIRVPWINAESGSSTFAYSTGYANSTDTVTGKNVTLDTLLYKRWDITDTDILRTSPEVLNKMGQKVGTRLASDALGKVFQAVTASNFAQVSALTSSGYNTQAAFVALQQSASVLLWPTEERSLIVNPTLYANIVSNTSLVNYAYGSPSVVQEGKLPKYFGFTPYVVTNLASNSENIQGFACSPDAMLVGMAYHRPQDEIPYTEKQVMKDNVTGLVIGFRQWGDWTLAKVNRVVDTLFGTAVGNPTAAIRITS